MAAGRWQRADENFRRQIDHFMVEARMTRSEIAAELGLSYVTWHKYYEHPSQIRKAVERQIAMCFEKHGMRYDMTLGESGEGRTC